MRRRGEQRLNHQDGEVRFRIAGQQRNNTTCLRADPRCDTSRHRRLEQSQHTDHRSRGLLRDLLNTWNTDNCGDGGPPPIPNVWLWATRGAVADEEYQGPLLYSSPNVLNQVVRNTLFGLDLLDWSLQQIMDWAELIARPLATAAAGATPLVTSRLIFILGAP